MRASQFFYITDRNDPADAELPSHKLMVRSGMIRKVTSGVYTWLPMGLRVVKKVEQIVREEMNRAGAIEMLMPALQPAELWKQSKRWEKYGAELMRLKDRHQRDFCLGPTHEEVITALAGNDIKSYKQLPINLYQIQTKFRDEVRPRFGVMRGREFVMKDAYSFHADFACLEKTYQTMYTAYSRMFSRMGLRYRSVAADTGAIGGNHSHEFQVLADAGEDLIAYCEQSDYAANIELCPLSANAAQRPLPTQALTSVPTPNVSECAQVAEQLKVPITQMIKSLLITNEAGHLVLVLLRGDHMLNSVKLKKILQCDEVNLASSATVLSTLGANVGSIGPINAPSGLRVLADYALQTMSDAVCGANIDHQHFIGVNIGRDCPEPAYHDLRFAVAGDLSPDGQGVLSLCRGIEVGHIFQLRTRYSETMGATFQNAEGVQSFFEMGCYGIGITRIVAAAIEQTAQVSAEGKVSGMALPMPIAPFQVYLSPIGYYKSASVQSATETLYAALIDQGIEVYWDDRNERPGVMFADHELSGIPIRLVVSDKHLANQQIECTERAGDPHHPQTRLIAYAEAVATIKTLIESAMPKL